ncbi:stage III sporulation protein AA [Bacillus massilinigeriensis]|uniref:stage III sporulation protein AA n=1 Tax=Bacillus mediterraneensis TaxID=1805474 RepID=UPI0008F896D7|nr:stage III sporulation protein AA [Bacillus mediterraneensis]
MEKLFSFLPKAVSDQLRHLSHAELMRAEEIRIRINRPIEINVGGKALFLSYIATLEDGVQLLNKLSNFSMYTLEEELKRGYITIAGGHRVGLAGKVILDGGKVKSIRDVGSFNIRIAKEKIGTADVFAPFLYGAGWKHTMIIGPPQTGKTTLLRDIARLISKGCSKRSIPACKAGIIDERSEIAGCLNGIPQFTFGPRIDVLDSCPKAEGMMMMIRSMSPDVIVVDEAGSVEDAAAILEAANAGITLLMTVHGKSLLDIRRRPVMKEIIEEGIFERYIELSREAEQGNTACIKDNLGKVIKSKIKVRIA